jgi:hypothetical protein
LLTHLFCLAEHFRVVDSLFDQIQLECTYFPDRGNASWAWYSLIFSSPFFVNYKLKLCMISSKVPWLTKVLYCIRTAYSCTKSSTDQTWTVNIFTDKKTLSEHGIIWFFPLPCLSLLNSNCVYFNVSFHAFLLIK